MSNNNWFTVEKIDDTTYAISEYGHWENAHSYLLLGKEQACLIDTGLGIGNIKEVVDELTELPISVITTHVHWDHIGGHGLFDNIQVHGKDSEWLRDGIPVPLNNIRQNLVRDLTKPLPEDFDIEEYYPYQGQPQVELADGDLISLGNRELKVIHTPGHSPGHICLYEKERGYLFTGDLLYKGTLFAFFPSTNPLQFAQSIYKIAQLDKVSRILPGHHQLEISDKFLDKAKSYFEKLEKEDLLYQGSGLHDFGDLKIKL